MNKMQSKWTRFWKWWNSHDLTMGIISLLMVSSPFALIFVIQKTVPRPTQAQFEAKNPPVQYTNLDAIYMHEPTRYSFIYTIDSESKIKTISGKKVTFFTDVPTNKKPWIQQSQWDYSMAIHLHSIDELNTAGWDHGKLGSGQTIRIDK